MLFIYGSLALGGIETFYVRMARARFENGLKTKILLTSRRGLSDIRLLNEMKCYADVFYLEDCFKYGIEKRIPFHFSMLIPFDKKAIKNIFNEVDHVHVSNSIYALLYFEFLKIIEKNIPLTMGVYHSKEYIWGGNKLPFFEKINRNIFNQALLNNSVIFFNERLPEIYKEKYNFLEDKRNIFPLGVVQHESKDFQKKSSFSNRKLRIVSVGRLVSFKTYNFWMINVIHKMIKNHDIEYHIYGNGPNYDELYTRINELNLGKVILLKGELPYADFKDVVGTYDLFVGSGTSIIEASSIGIPCVVGVESVAEPLTYGFLCDISGFSYNEDGLYTKYDAISLIEKFCASSQEEKIIISDKHVEWSKKFTMNVCVENFEKVSLRTKENKFRIISFKEKIKYALSFFIFSIQGKIFKKSIDKYF